MSFSGYKFKFRLNIAHSFVDNGFIGDMHYHTVEINMFIQNLNDDIRYFQEVEYLVKSYLNQH